MSLGAALDSRLAEQASRLDGLAEAMSDVAASVRRYVELLDSDPARLEAIESRLAVLDGIKRKHGGAIESARRGQPRPQTHPGVTREIGAARAAARAE